MSSTTGPSRSRSERVVAWTVLLLLLFGDVLVLRPFGSALVWAMVLVCSSWPLYSRVTVRLRHRRTLAAGLMALGMVLVFLVPVVTVGSTLTTNVKELTVAARRALEQGPPPPPAWLVKLPVVGQTASDPSCAREDHYYYEDRFPPGVPKKLRSPATGPLNTMSNITR